MYLPDANPEALLGALSGLRLSHDDAVLILLAAKNAPPLDQLVSAVSTAHGRFAGGIFPGVLSDGQKYEEGAVVLALPALAPPLVVTGIDRDGGQIPSLPEGMAAHLDKRCTALVLLDGLAPNLSVFLGNLFALAGNAMHYLGGGAGPASLEHVPCLFTGDGVFRDAAVVLFLDLDSALGVRHGWARFAGPVLATRTRGNRVYELNWKQAFEVYRELVEPSAGSRLRREGFYGVASGYPFGMIRERAEYIVRDAVAVGPEGELVCVGEVPENTVLNILHGDPERLIAAAAEAAAEAAAGVSGRAACCLVVDCVSRSLFLREDFGRELAGVAAKVRAADRGLTSEGVLSVGEVSASGEGYLNLFNKTIVVGILYHG